VVSIRKVSIGNRKSVAIFSPLLLLLSSVALGQTSPGGLPCKFSGELQQTPSGKVVWYTSGEMKDRATHKVDLSGFILRADIKGTVLVEVLVGTSGEIVCLTSVTKQPWIQSEVEKALKSWKFRRAEVNGKAVAYLGRMEFILCNILCGDQGPSMTLFK
jgi:Gram-negative bacterial TonB protein C-terminal